MDACDDVMTKTKKTAGLIRYTSEVELQGRVPRRWRARTVALAAAFALSLSSLIGFALLHEPLDIAWLRAKGAPYDVIHADGREDIVVNRFQVELSNQSDIERQIRISPVPSQAAAGLKVVVAMNPLRIQSGRLQRADVFVRLPKSAFTNGKAIVAIQAEDLADGTRHEKEVTLVGPF
jgi:polyferredoxin